MLDHSTALRETTLGYKIPTSDRQFRSRLPTSESHARSLPARKPCFASQRLTLWQPKLRKSGNPDVDQQQRHISTRGCSARLLPQGKATPDSECRGVFPFER